MAKRKSGTGEKEKKTPKTDPSSVRDGGTRLKVSNSGLEVWLYDDGNFQTLQDSGALDFENGGGGSKFQEMAKKGAFVGYSLLQDDEVDVAVYVGKPLTDKELSVARWLEPQTAFLRLPTGKLCVESNDARRIGQEQTGAKGAQVTLPPGDYRLSLYRIDHEALDREELSWSGPQEVIVLTPGGSSRDAVDDLLPIEQRRDLSWVGNYKIKGARAEALAWFGDYWDTFILNLDSAAAPKLSLAPGCYIRTHVPAAGIALISAFAKSWADAKRIPVPGGIELEEYGYAAFCPMGDWDQKEALFCRRDKTKRRIEDKHHNVWLPAIVEILDLKPAPKRSGRGLSTIDLAAQDHYFDPGFLGLILSDVLPEVADQDELSLSEALKLFDKKLGKLGLKPHGDFTWEEKLQGPAADSNEVSCRLYAGLPDTIFAIVASEAFIQVLFLSELGNDAWIVSGLTDDFERLIAAAGNGRVQVQSIDEELSKIRSAHEASLSKSKKPVAAPSNAKEATAAFTRFLKAAFG